MKGTVHALNRKKPAKNCTSFHLLVKWYSQSHTRFWYDYPICHFNMLPHTHALLFFLTLLSLCYQKFNCPFISKPQEIVTDSSVITSFSSFVNHFHISELSCLKCPYFCNIVTTSFVMALFSFSIHRLQTTTSAVNGYRMIQLSTNSCSSILRSESRK